jgi:predicted AAA+ superfamily ATPase
MNKIVPFIDAPFVKILTGVRRCGKSTILAMLHEELKKRDVLSEQILSYKFDSLQYEDIDTGLKLYKECVCQQKFDPFAN